MSDRDWNIAVAVVVIVTATTAFILGFSMGEGSVEAIDRGSHRSEYCFRALHRVTPSDSLRVYHRNPDCFPERP